MQNKNKYIITENLDDYIGYTGQLVTFVPGSVDGTMVTVSDEIGNCWTLDTNELMFIPEAFIGLRLAWHTIPLLKQLQSIVPSLAKALEETMVDTNAHLKILGDFNFLMNEFYYK